MYKTSAGVEVEVSIRPSVIAMVDDFYGQAPIMVGNPSVPGDRVIHRRPTRIVIGQQAPKEMPEPKASRKGRKT